MDDHKAILRLSAGEIANAVRSKKVSPSEVVSIFLKQVNTLNPTYRAFSDIFDEDAMEQAKYIEENFSKFKDGKLCGVPVVVDQSFYIKGKDRSLGSAVYVDRIHREDGNGIARLKKAGAILLGRSYMSEFGMTSWELPQGSEEYQHPFIEDHTPPLFTGEGTAITLRMAALAFTKDKLGGSIVSSAVNGVSSFVQPNKDLFLNGQEEYSLSEARRRFLRIGVSAHSPEDIDLGMRVLTECSDSLFSKKEKKTKLKIAWSSSLSNIFPHADERYHFDTAVTVLKESGHELSEIEFGMGSSFYVHVGNLFSCEHYYPIVSKLEELKVNASKHLSQSTVDWLNYAQHVSGVGFSVSSNIAYMLRESVESILQENDLLIIPSIPFSPVHIPIFKNIDQLPDTLVSYLSFWAYTLIFAFSQSQVLSIPIKSSGDYPFTSIQVAASKDKKALLGSFYNELKEKDLIFDHEPDCLCF